MNKTLSRVSRDTLRLFERLRKLPPKTDKPVFIILSGLPGTGKTYFGHHLAQRIPLVILESDELRKTLFPHPVYSGYESARLFMAIYNLIEMLLKSGISVLLDATNLTESSRKRLYSIARKASVGFIVVRVKAPQSVVYGRLNQRLESPTGHSDAGWEVYKLMKNREERIHQRHYVVDTTKDINPVIDQIANEVES